MLSDPLAQRVTWTLIHFVWQGAAIAAVLAILLRTRLVLTPQRRYAASVAALAMMALGTLVTCIWNEECRNPNVEVNPNVEIQMMKQQASTLGHLDIPHSFGIRISAFVIGQQPPVRDRLPSIQPYLLMVWTFGVLVLGGRLVFGYLGTLWLRGRRDALPEPVALRVEELCRTFGVATACVYASPRVREALAVGFWRPVVLVPLAWLTELPADVLEAVIAHELAHIRRWDRWVVLFQRSMETLLFYHPAVWWVSRTISFERELCCDEMAVAATGRRLAYARALEAVGRQSVADLSLIFATSFQGEPDMKLLARVRNVLGLHPRREAGLAWPAGLLALTVGLCLSLWSLSSVLAAGDEPPGKTKVAREGEKENAKKISPEEAAKRESADVEAARQRQTLEAALEDIAVQRKLLDAKLKALEAAKAKIVDEEAVQRKLIEAKKKDKVEASALEALSRKLDENYKRQAENAFKGAVKGEAGGLEDFKPQTDREAALFKLIVALRDEVAQLRKDVNQMRGAPYLEKKQAPGKGETIKQPPRDGEAYRKAGPRDGEVIKKGPPDSEPIKKTPPDKADPR